MDGIFGVFAGIGVLSLCLFAGIALVIWAEQPDLNTTTIHKTQDRLPVACEAKEAGK